MSDLTPEPAWDSTVHNSVGTWERMLIKTERERDAALAALDAAEKERDEANDRAHHQLVSRREALARVAALEKALMDSDRALLDCKIIAERATVNDLPWKEPNEIAYRVTTARNAISKALSTGTNYHDPATGEI